MQNHLVAAYLDALAPKAWPHPKAIISAPKPISLTIEKLRLARRGLRLQPCLVLFNPALFFTDKLLNRRKPRAMRGRYLHLPIRRGDFQIDVPNRLKGNIDALPSDLHLCHSIPSLRLQQNNKAS